MFGYKAGFISPVLFATLISLMFGCQNKIEDQAPKARIKKQQLTANKGITEQDDLLNLPGPPSKARVIREEKTSDSQYQIIWRGTRDDTISGYRIYQLDTQKNWKQIGVIELRKEDSRNRGEYRFSKEIDADGVYSIAAVKNKNIVGPKSPEIQFKQPTPAPKD